MQYDVKDVCSLQGTVIVILLSNRTILEKVEHLSANRSMMQFDVSRRKHVPNNRPNPPFYYARVKPKLIFQPAEF